MHKSCFTMLSLLASVFVCVGCQQQPLNYDYLMQHPEVLLKQYERCRGQSTAYCDEVVRAAEDFNALTHQRAENAELMGMQIMKAQQAGDENKVKTLYAVVRATSAE